MALNDMPVPFFRYTGWMRKRRRGWWKSRALKSTTISFQLWRHLILTMGLSCRAATIGGTQLFTSALVQCEKLDDSGFPKARFTHIFRMG